jgi:hypothetical protein
MANSRRPTLPWRKPKAEAPPPSPQALVLKLAPHVATLSQHNITHEVEFDFAATGEFDSIAYGVECVSDAPALIICEDKNRKTPTRAALTLFLPAVQMSGFEPPSLVVELSVILWGVGTSKVDANQPGAATWTAARPV